MPGATLPDAVHPEILLGGGADHVLDRPAIAGGDVEQRVGRVLPVFRADDVVDVEAVTHRVLPSPGRVVVEHVDAVLIEERACRAGASTDADVVCAVVAAAASVEIEGGNLKVEKKLKS